MTKPDMKFLVLKVEDIFKYLDGTQVANLEDILGSIGEGRFKDGKKPDNEYLVVNRDEKYSDQIWDIIVQNEKVE